MKQAEIELLTEIYDHYKKNNQREYNISYSRNPQEKRSLCNSLDYLEECGYIKYTARAMGFCQLKLTIEGIQFVENGFHEPELSPVIQGNNSIYINGSGNTVSDNYNQLSVNISQSDLPDDIKKLIETLLYEMKNPHLTPEKKSGKIKTFLSDITSDTISGAAASGLTVLLSSLFSQIPM